MKILFFAAALAVFFSGTTGTNAQDGERLYRIIHKGKYGFIDKTGKVIVPAQYERAGEFSEGLASLLTDKGYGFIDVSGQFVIKPAYSDVENFVDGIAAVIAPAAAEPSRYRKTYIDKTGKVVLDLGAGDEYYLSSFSEGLTVRFSGKQAGFIDKTGKFVIEPKFDMAFNFSEGLAQVRIGRKYGYIDKSGKMVIEPQFPQPTTMDHIGRPHFTDHRHPFRNGLASIAVDNSGRHEWSVIDKTGKIIFTPSPGNYAPFNFSEGLLRFREKYTEGFLNPDGSVAIKATWYTVEDFSEGLAAVSHRNLNECPDSLDNCWGFVDKTGAVVIKPQFASADGFKGGLAWVMTRKTDPKDGRMYFTVGYIDRTGKFVWSAPAN